MEKLSCIYQIVKEVDFFQLKKSDNPFKCVMSVRFGISGIKLGKSKRVTEWRVECECAAVFMDVGQGRTYQLKRQNFS